MAEGTILVAGGTGTIGSEVAVALARAGWTVRILTRDAARARRMFSDEYEIAEGDATREDSLDEAVKDCKAIFISISGGGDTERDSVRNLVAAAGRNGVSHIMYVSGSTVSEPNTWSPMIRAKWDAEHIVQESGIPWTIFRPTWFTDSLPRFVRNGRAMLFGKSDNQWNWVTAGDFAKMVVRTCELDEARGKVFYIHGPEALTIRKALEVCCYVAHPSAKVKVISFWTLRLLAFIYRRPQLKAVIPVMDYFAKTPQEGDPKEADELLGTPTTTVAEWADARKRG